MTTTTCKLIVISLQPLFLLVHYRRTRVTSESGKENGNEEKKRKNIIRQDGGDGVHVLNCKQKEGERERGAKVAAAAANCKVNMNTHTHTPTQQKLRHQSRGQGKQQSPEKKKKQSRLKSRVGSINQEVKEKTFSIFRQRAMKAAEKASVMSEQGHRAVKGPAALPAKQHSHR